MSNNAIKSVRSAFLNIAEIHDFPFHAADLKRVTQNDEWIRSVLKENNGKIRESVDRILRCLEFRNVTKINNIDVEYLREVCKELTKEKSIFICGKDRDRNPVIVIDVLKSEYLYDVFFSAYNVRNLKSKILYVLEKVLRLNNWNKISVLLKYPDYFRDFAPFLVAFRELRTLYPGILSQFLLYTASLNCSPPYYLVKPFLEDLKPIFIDSSNVTEYIESDQIKPKRFQNKTQRKSEINNKTSEEKVQDKTSEEKIQNKTSEKKVQDKTSEEKVQDKTSEEKVQDKENLNKFVSSVESSGDDEINKKIKSKRTKKKINSDKNEISEVNKSSLKIDKQTGDKNDNKIENSEVNDRPSCGIEGGEQIAEDGILNVSSSSPLTGEDFKKKSLNNVMQMLHSISSQLEKLKEYIDKIN